MEKVIAFGRLIYNYLHDFADYILGKTVDPNENNGNNANVSGLSKNYQRNDATVIDLYLNKDSTTGERVTELTKNEETSQTPHQGNSLSNTSNQADMDGFHNAQLYAVVTKMEGDDQQVQTEVLHNGNSMTQEENMLKSLTFGRTNSNSILENTGSLASAKEDRSASEYKILDHLHKTRQGDQNEEEDLNVLREHVSTQSTCSQAPRGNETSLIDLTETSERPYNEPYFKGREDLVQSIENNASKEERREDLASNSSSSRKEHKTFDVRTGENQNEVQRNQTESNVSTGENGQQGNATEKHHIESDFSKSLTVGLTDSNPFLKNTGSLEIPINQSSGSASTAKNEQQGNTTENHHIESDLSKSLTFGPTDSNPVLENSGGLEIPIDLSSESASTAENEQQGNATEKHHIKIDEDFQNPEDFKIVQLHHHFEDLDIDLTENRIEYMKKVENKAKAFEEKVDNYSGTDYSVEYFILDENLMRLLEAIDKVKCNNDVELLEEKIKVIDYINQLHEKLDGNIKIE